MLKLSSLIINKGVAFGQILAVFLSVIPTFLEFAIPLATLLGVMLAFARLSGDSEIVVIRASGVSFRQLIKPVLLFGVIVGFISLFVSTTLKPWGFASLSDTLFEIARTKTTAGLEEGIFNKIGKTRMLYAEKIDDQSGGLEKVLLDDRQAQGGRQVIFAKAGRIVPDPAHRMIFFQLFNGTIHQIVDGRYSLTDFKSNITALSSDELYDPDAAQKGKSAREMTNRELVQSLEEYDVVLERLRQEDKIQFSELSSLLQPQLSNQTLDTSTVRRKRTRIEVERASRVSMPCASFILALVAMPLGIQPPRMQRTWGAGLSAAVGLLVFVVYYAVLSVGITASESAGLPPILATWMPNILAALVAGFMIQRISSERWHSVAHGVEFLIAAFRERFPGRKA